MNSSSDHGSAPTPQDMPPAADAGDATDNVGTAETAEPIPLFPWQREPLDLAITYGSLWILAGALAAGMLSDALLRASPLGIGLLLWACGVIAIAAFVSWRAQRPLHRQVVVPAAAAIACAAGVVWRDSHFLCGLDVAMIVVCTGAAALGARSRDLRSCGIADVPRSILMAGFHSIGGPAPVWSQEMDWTLLGHARFWRHGRAVIRGIVIALPLVFIFGYLFVSADMQFENLVKRLFRWNPRTAGMHVLVAAAWAWAMAGFLRYLLVAKHTQSAPSEPRSDAIGPIEVAIILGSLNLLFLAFVITQFPQLFGGLRHLLETANLTAAQYARRGFFQLATASTLVLPVLLYGHWLLRRDTSTAERVFRPLSVSLIAMLFLIMASALQRMRLYTASFGLTELRFYVTAFMLCLAVLFVWFGLSVLRGRRDLFVAGAFVVGFSSLMLLHAVNPDGIIARTNLSRVETRIAIDPAYLSSLSADAVPALVRALPAMRDERLAESVRTIILRHANPAGTADWQSWNWSRMEAAAAGSVRK